MAGAEKILRASQIPNFSFPDDAVRSFNSMWRYKDSLRALYETPSLGLAERPAASAARVAQTLADVRSSGRTLLTEFESKSILSEYGFSVPALSIARSADEAEAFAEKIGYPIVLKLHSHTITHKSDVGGVQLNLGDRAAVRAAYELIERTVAERAGSEHFLGVTVQSMIKREGYELILGSSVDPQFGPVLLFGLGGQLVEVFKDRSLGLPPLNQTLAMRMMERTKIFHALQGVRGRAPIDLAALASLLVRFSDLVVEQPLIAEIDINPLLASPDGLWALDGRIVLHAKDKLSLPRPAIRPYPAQYASDYRFQDGSRVVLRPIRPEDEPLLRAYHEKLSEKTVYQRYLQPLGVAQRTAHDRLTRICFADYDREVTLICESSGTDGKKEMVGIGRLRKIRGSDDAELTLSIRDDRQRQGLGHEIVRRLLGIATAERRKTVIARMLSENKAMLAICRELEFKIEPDPENPERSLARWSPPNESQ